MNHSSFSNIIKEPAKEIQVYKEADVVVVGGGPAGIGAAVSASRNGAHTILVERYGHLGGLATGGLVSLIMPMSDGTAEQQISGICQEMVTRLDSRGAAVHPKKENLGSNDPGLINLWQSYAFCIVENRVRLSVSFNPEIFKCVLNDITEESGVTLVLHSWSTRTIVSNNTVQGIIFESKSGRQAILGKAVIDTTGDGDVMASAGAEFDSTLYPQLRSSKLALVFRIGNIDIKRYLEFRRIHSQEYADLMHKLETLGGFTLYIRGSQDDVLWVNSFIPDKNGLNIEDLTRVEVDSRKRMLITYDFLKKYIPGFERSFIMDTASQIGVRCSRRLVGEYIVTEKDLQSGIVHPDTVAICPDFRHTVSKEYPHWHIPYRALIPRKIDNLLVAGRCLSSDPVANDLLSPIQFCIAMGQAAGTAAALAVKHDIKPRQLDYGILRNVLEKQGVPLPGN